MSKFWDHYAKANDDIRSELVDKAWFQQRTGSTAMQDDVQAQKAANTHGNQEGETAAVVDTSGLGTPEHQQVHWTDEETTANPDATRDAVQDFYGIKPAPCGNELGGSFEDERTFADQEDDLAKMRHSDFDKVYGKPPQQAEQNDVYGYQALETPEEDHEPEM